MNGKPSTIALVVFFALAVVYLVGHVIAWTLS